MNPKKDQHKISDDLFRSTSKQSCPELISSKFDRVERIGGHEKVLGMKVAFSSYRRKSYMEKVLLCYL